MAHTIKQPYRKSRAFDSSCRNHGDCPWCAGNRKHRVTRRVVAAHEDLRTYLEGEALDTLSVEPHTVEE